MMYLPQWFLPGRAWVCRCGFAQRTGARRSTHSIAPQCARLNVTVQHWKLRYVGASIYELLNLMNDQASRFLVQDAVFNKRYSTDIIHGRRFRRASRGALERSGVSQWRVHRAVVRDGSRKCGALWSLPAAIGTRGVLSSDHRRALLRATRQQPGHLDSPQCRRTAGGAARRSAHHWQRPGAFSRVGGALARQSIADSTGPGDEIVLWRRRNRHASYLRFPRLRQHLEQPAAFLAAANLQGRLAQRSALGMAYVVTAIRCS